MNVLIRTVEFCILSGTIVFLCSANAAQETSQVTIEEAKKFIETTNTLKKEVTDRVDEAWYIRDRYWTLDTDNHRTELYNKAIAVEINSAYEAIKYKDLNLNKDLSRRLADLLWMGDYLSGHPHPEGERKVALLKKTTDELTQRYSSSTACINSDSNKEICFNAHQLSEKMAASDNEGELKSLWEAWHNNMASLKPLFQQQLQLNNEGAQRFGFSNRAEMQLSEFERPLEDLLEELDRTWNDVKPLYDALHLHIRNKLDEKYGEDFVPVNQTIPAHLLGSPNVTNLSQLYDLVKPEGAVTDRGYNIDVKLKEKPDVDVESMVRGFEQYMTSLGFAPFKESLYENSQFTKPTTHKAACDSTAWWLPAYEEARVGGCWDVNAATFKHFHTAGLMTPLFFRASHAKQPVHYTGHYSRFPIEIFGGISRALRYAYTPDYLQEIGMLDQVPDESADLGYLMELALSTIANLPYKLAVTRWQKEVAFGEISADDYNKRWWELREHYQGITAPAARHHSGFDAAAAPGVVSNQNQVARFIAEVLGFQFYQSLCDLAGKQNKLSRCSFYGSKAIGAKLQASLESGSSRPWYEVMSIISGQSTLEGKAVTHYFKPLQDYLDKQNTN